MGLSLYIKGIERILGIFYFFFLSHVGIGEEPSVTVKTLQLMMEINRAAALISIALPLKVHLHFKSNTIIFVS